MGFFRSFNKNKQLSEFKQKKRERKNIRAQAAMEFLMTYGWAILVVLIVIGALTYFGILDPSTLIPDKCTLPMGLSCTAYKVFYDTNTNDHGVLITLQNGMGKGIIIKNITFESMSGSTGVPIVSNCYADLSSVDNFNGLLGLHLDNGESKTIFVGSGSVTGATQVGQCTVNTLKGKYKIRIRLVWHFDDITDAFSKTMKGEMMTAVETS